MSDIVGEINQTIYREEQRIIDSGLSGQMAIIELARAIDYFLIGVRYFDAKRKIGEETIELYNNCWPYAIKHFYENMVNQNDVPLFSSNESISGWADLVLQHSGRIALLKKLLDLYKSGMYSFKKISNDEYQFKLLPKKTLGAEYFEVKEFERQDEEILQSQYQQWEQLKAERNVINLIMRDLVWRWKKDFIGYSTNSIVDEYYNKMALLEAERMPGIKDFSDNVTFGGIKFKMYRNAVISTISWSLKHMDFCFELMQKYPDVNLRNILVKFQPIREVISYLASAIDADLNTAKKILSTLILCRENSAYYCYNITNVLPPFIEIGENQLLYSNIGCMVNPFLFMLKELSRQYPKEWDKAIMTRESIMRDELYELFSVESLIKIRRNFNLKDKNQILTDIDACIIDPNNNEIGIFQIKWQEPYGSIMTERSSKKTNFLNKSNNWIDKVDDWFKNNGCIELSSILGQKRFVMGKMCKIRLFVIGRYSAHFSGNEYPDERAAWGVWPQVLNLMSKNIYDENPIEYLFQALKENSPIKNKMVILGRDELKFENKVFSVLPQDH